MSEKEELVSIIMPVYNGMPSIIASIKSLYNQTYPFWECIIINDGSSDGTKEYLDSLKDPKLVIHHFSRNRGRAQARQKGLDLATGKYISMLDADDLYHPNKLKLQVDTMNKNPDILLVGAGMCSFGSKIDFIRVRSKGNGKTQVYNSKDAFPVAHGPSMLRHSFAINFKYNPTLNYGEDLDYLDRYLDGRKYINLPDVLYYYSEFDSVTKSKIRKSYLQKVKKYFYAREYSLSALYIIKLVYSCVVYPFIGVNQILDQRGNQPSQKEYNDFQEFCLPLVKMVKI